MYFGSEGQTCDSKWEGGGGEGGAEFFYLSINSL